MWHLEGVGGQLALEGLQRCLSYCSPRELVPQDDGSWKEALLVRPKEKICVFPVTSPKKLG